MKYAVKASDEAELREILERMDLNIDQVKYKFLSKNEAAEIGLDKAAVVEEVVPDRAARLTRRILYMMGFKAKVKAVEYDDLLTIEVEGEELGPLIGARGKTLVAFETMLAAIINKNALVKKRVSLDIAGYRKRREEKLEKMALEAAEIARKEKKPVPLSPMPAHERKFVHSILTDVGGVDTRSEGEEPDRRIVVFPV